MKNRVTRQGFTLVEIAIVLVIIGLLLGGILKGQELINNAKVRAIADRQNSLKVAWFSFIDRFGSIPGDYVDADVTIPDAAKGKGDGTIDADESIIVFQHLTGSGYLRCPVCTADSVALPTASNSLVNTYGGVMSIWNDQYYYALISTTGGFPRLQVHTGPRIPSNIISEVDRKIDDGTPTLGDVVFNQFDPTSSTYRIQGTVGLEECIKGARDGTIKGKIYAPDGQFWRPTAASPPVFQDCGAGVFI